LNQEDCRVESVVRMTVFVRHWAEKQDGRGRSSGRYGESAESLYQPEDSIVRRKAVGINHHPPKFFLYHTSLEKGSSVKRFRA